MYRNIIGVKPAYYFKACGIQRFHPQEVCARNQLCILPKVKKSVTLFYIKNFSCHVRLLLKRKLQHVCHKWVIQGQNYVGHIWIVLWVSGSNGLTDATNAWGNLETSKSTSFPMLDNLMMHGILFLHLLQLSCYAHYMEFQAARSALLTLCLL